MENRPTLNFPACRLRLRHRGSVIQVWDELRRMWLVLTPEEWVRRHLIGWLCTSGIDKVRIVQEYPVPMQGMSQRADVVVFDAGGCPLLLAECKAPHIRIDGGVLAQAVRYNHVVGARYILITNGLAHYCYECSENGCIPLQTLPPLGNPQP